MEKTSIQRNRHRLRLLPLDFSLIVPVPIFLSIKNVASGQLESIGDTSSEDDFPEVSRLKYFVSVWLFNLPVNCF